MSKLLKLEKAEALESTHGTSLKGHLYGVTYAQLYDAFGEPTFLPEDSGDGKVNFEWAFKFNNEVFTIYDWKTWDAEYTVTELDKWNIGGKTFYGDFHDFVIKSIKHKTLQ